jgi:hypothetical protein
MAVADDDGDLIPVWDFRKNGDPEKGGKPTPLPFNSPNRYDKSGLALTGFGELELGDLLADRTQGLTDPDDAPAAPEHPVSRTGDLWLLGAKVTCPKCRKTTPLERAVRK